MRKDRRLRRLRWAGVALLLAYALYLVLGNLFVNSAFAQTLVNGKPEKFRMQWSGGQTWWPGRVALREVRMQGHVRRTQWSVDAARVHGRIALWPLLRKEIRVPWVEAEGVGGSVDRVQTEIVPPAHRDGGWTLRMDRIASDSITGGTVFGWTLTGQGKAVVGFSKQFRGGPAELFPSSAAFQALDASRDGRHWLRQGRVDATFRMARHLSSEFPGLAKLDLFAATLALDATTVALRSTLGDEGGYHFEAIPGDGRVDARLSLAHGRLTQGDHLRLQAPLIAVDADGAVADNTLQLSLDVDHDLRLRASVPERDGQHASLEADLHVPGTALPLGDWRVHLAQASGSARGRWQVPSIGGLLALFAQADWLDLDGSGSVEADLQLHEGSLAEGSRLRVEDVVASAEVLGNRFSGRARAEAVIEAAADGSRQSRVDVAMTRFEAAPAARSSRKFVTGNDLRLELVSDAQLQRMPDTLRARLRFERATVPDLTVFNPYLPNDTLRFRGGSGVLTGDLQVDADGDVGTGTLRVDGRQARLAVADVDLRGDIAIDARLRRGNLQRGNFALGGSRVSVRNVAFTERGGTSRSGWWATVELDDGRVAWKQPSSADGRIRARMKDVGFLLALFADRADYPGWIGRVVDDGEARLEGRWAWRDDALVLDRMHAANDRFKVDARLRLQGDARHGDLHVGWGRLGVGVELQGAQRRFHLRNARQWYDDRPDLLP